MSKIEKLLGKARSNPQKFRFAEVCRLAEAFGFMHRAGRGSHRVYTKKGVDYLLNFQNVGGMAKPYQVRQLLRVVDEHKLKLEDD